MNYLNLLSILIKTKNIYVIINYYAPADAYEIEMREYDYAHYAAYHVKRIIQVNDLLSAKIPTHEVIVKVLNEMYEELKRGDNDERESRKTSKRET